MRVSNTTRTGLSLRECSLVRIITVISLGLFASGCDQPPPKPAAAATPPQVSVAKPVLKEIIERDEFTGRFEAVQDVEIRSRVNGYLASIHFRDGAMVKEGELLFVIDPRPYQATLNQAKANLTAAEARAEFARVELSRTQRLTQSGAAAERSLDERRQQFQTAQADIAAFRAATDQAQLDLGFTAIHAPISGRISRKLVTEGNLVSANATLLTTIVALDPIYFYFDVDERSYLAYTRMGIDGSRPSSRGSNPPEVMVALADEREPTRVGRMDFVDNRVDAASGTMRGRAIFENKDFLLAPGLFGRISIPGSGRYQAVLVPDEAIGADLDRRFVYVVAEDGSVSQKVVRPGSRHDGYRIIRQGLDGSETIIVNGTQRARFAGKVTPQRVELPPTRSPQQASAP